MRRNTTDCPLSCVVSSFRNCSSLHNYIILSQLNLNKRLILVHHYHGVDSLYHQLTSKLYLQHIFTINTIVIYHISLRSFFLLLKTKNHFCQFLHVLVHTHLRQTLKHQRLLFLNDLLSLSFSVKAINSLYAKVQAKRMTQ